MLAPEASSRVKLISKAILANINYSDAVKEFNLVQFQGITKYLSNILIR